MDIRSSAWLLQVNTRTIGGLAFAKEVERHSCFELHSVQNVLLLEAKKCTFTEKRDAAEPRVRPIVHGELCRERKQPTIVVHVHNSTYFSHWAFEDQLRVEHVLRHVGDQSFITTCGRLQLKTREAPFVGVRRAQENTSPFQDQSPVSLFPGFPNLTPRYNHHITIAHPCLPFCHSISLCS